jgi:SAM-dependent methyltransferase
LSALTRALHGAASHPAVYDMIQRLAGSDAVNRRFQSHFRGLLPAGWLIDLGGGTGFPMGGAAGRRYVCVDIDPAKLKGFQKNHPASLAVLGDVEHVPIASRSADLVICKAVAHHITDDALPGLFAEAARILKPDGSFAFCDAISAPQRWRSRLLWKYDRGSFPRSEQSLRREFERHFVTSDWERFEYHHAYAVGVGTPIA